jgi:hypothetical protein
VGAELPEHQRRHEREGYRALDALRRFRDLRLAPSCRPVQCCHQPRYRPPPPGAIDHLTSGRIGQIGHQACRVLRPMVTPGLAHEDGDIAKMAEARPLCVGPVGPTAAGLLPGDPAAAIMLGGPRPDESVQTVAVFKTPGPGQGPHTEGPTPAKQLKVGYGRQGGLGNYHDHRRPGRPPTADQHPAEQPMLRPLAGLVLAADKRAVNGDAVIPPVEHHDHQVQAKAIRGLVVQAPLLGHWMLLARGRLERALDDQRAHARLRRRQRGADVVGNPPPPDPPMPLDRRQQAAKMLRGARPWGQPCQAWEWRLVRIHRLADEPPAQDQMRARATHGPPHVQPVGHLVG